MRFLTNATDQLTEVLEDLDNSKMYWNFIYLGRKRLENTDEYWVPGMIKEIGLRELLKKIRWIEIHVQYLFVGYSITYYCVNDISNI